MAQLDSSTIYGNLTVNNNLTTRGLTTLNDLTVNNLITGSVSGNAATATKLATARTISLTGDVTGSVSFDGSGNASITTTYKNSGVSAGTYTSVTVDTKGNVTAGTNPGFITSYTNTVTTLTSGNAVTISDGGINGNHHYIIHHADTSSIQDLTATARSYVTGLTFDTYGHVIGVTTASETVVDTNNYLTGVSGTCGGTITFTRGGTSSLANLTWNSAHSHAYSSLTSRPTLIRESYVVPSGGLLKNTNLSIPNSKTYVLGSKTLKVFRDGLLQRVDSNSTVKDNDYWEVSTAQVRFNYSIPEGSIIDFEIIPLT